MWAKSVSTDLEISHLEILHFPELEQNVNEKSFNQS